MLSSPSGLSLNMFGIICVLLVLMTEGEGGNSCQILEAKPLKGKKPWARAMEKTCIDRFEECFLKCKKGNLRCLSFAVGYVSECPSGIQCLLYSEAFVYQRLLSRDDQYSYHVPGPQTCCDKPCLNNQSCRPDTCTCGCPPGYHTHHCVCPQANLSKVFDKDKPVVLSGVMKQVESGNQTWGVKEDQTVWVLQNDRWEKKENEKLNYISVGRAGVWGLDENNDVLRRQGINAASPFGTGWQQIPFPHQQLVQIDSGSSGVVYGVNNAHEIYCLNSNTRGTIYSTWLKVPGRAEHVSCGDYGCWVVDSNIARFREGVTPENCVGRSWVNVTNVNIMQLDSGKTGTVYAISTTHTLHRIRGLCSKLPYGSEYWGVIPIGAGLKQVTIGETHMYVVADNGTVFKYP